MRIFSRFLLATFLLLASILPAHADPLVPSTFNFQGSGYGHGVGMSQIGARAQALQGRTAIEILRYYYSYVKVEPIQEEQVLRVNIGHFVTNISLQTGHP